MLKIHKEDKSKYKSISDSYKFQERLCARKITKKDLLFYLTSNYSLKWETLENKSISLIYLEHKKECWHLIEITTQRRRNNYRLDKKK